MNIKRHHDARLSGFHGPFFTPSLDDLHELIVADRASKSEICEIAAILPEFDRMPAEWAITTDGYTWFAQLHFGTGADSVVILVPWARCEHTTGALPAARSIAAYAHHNDELVIERVINELLLVMRQAFNMQAVSAKWAQEIERVRRTSSLHRYMSP